MAKTKISEFDVDPSNNTDINSINIAEGCAPSGINNAIRQLMSDLKEWQNGSSGDSMTVAGTLDVTGNLHLDGAAGTAGQVLLSAGSGATPTWGNSFVSGMIMLWSGSVATIPSGWLLCNGSNGTPDLRNRFVIGAHSDDINVAKTTVTESATTTGGSKDAIVVSHTHTATVSDPGHRHTIPSQTASGSVWPSTVVGGFSETLANEISGSNTTGISVSNSTTGSSGTNANLPPYYALAYIMKS